MSGSRWSPPVIALGVLMAASAALLLAFRERLGFMLDDWWFVINRNQGGVGDFLDPHNEHISVIPVAIYKVFLTVFGVENPMPLQVLSVAVFLLSVVALFLYMRTLVGEPVSVIGCAIILFFGFASEDLLWAFQIGFSLSIASGIGALLMLRRNDRFGDRWACVLLSVSILSTSLGLPFLAGAAVEILLRRDRVAYRAFVVLVPAAIFAIWWLGWGHEAPNAASLSNALGVPEYVYGAFRIALSGLTGAFKVGGTGGTWLINPTAAAVLAGTAAYLAIHRRLPRPLVVAVVIALAFWGLAALNEVPGRSFEASRYQYPGAVFILMMLAGAYEGLRPRMRLLALLGLVAIVSVYGNVTVMRDSYRGVFKPLYEKGLAGLTALDVAREQVDPNFRVGLNENELLTVTAGDYFDAESRYGSAGWDESEIADQPPPARARIDQVLVGALPITGERTGLKVAGPGCRPLTAAPAPPEAETIEVTGRSLLIRPDHDVFVTVGRFADGASTGALVLNEGAATLMRFPGDRSDVPWRVGFLGEGDVDVCPAGPATG